MPLSSLLFVVNLKRQPDKPMDLFRMTQLKENVILFFFFLKGGGSFVNEPWLYSIAKRVPRPHRARGGISYEELGLASDFLCVVAI